MTPKHLVQYLNTNRHLLAVSRDLPFDKTLIYVKGVDNGVYGGLVIIIEATQSVLAETTEKGLERLVRGLNFCYKELSHTPFLCPKCRNGVMTLTCQLTHDWMQKGRRMSGLIVGDIGCAGFVTWSKMVPFFSAAENSLNGCGCSLDIFQIELALRHQSDWLIPLGKIASNRRDVRKESYPHVGDLNFTNQFLFYARFVANVGRAGINQIE